MPSKRANPEKIKVGTMLKKKNFMRLKELAFREGRGIGEVLDSAIENYAKPGAAANSTLAERIHSVLHPGWSMSRQEIEAPIEDELYGE